MTPSTRSTLRKTLSCAVFLALAKVTSVTAGDLLRAGAGPKTNAPAASSGAVTAQAAKAQANASDTLARNAAALRSMQSMQAAAQKIALTDPNRLRPNLPVVPNGLVAGGLVPDTGLTAPGNANPTINWIGASKPIQIRSGGTTKVNIVQTQSQALLNWATFNVGKKTQVTFDQRAGGKNASQWIAFNKIDDPSGNPSQILGSLDAVGQIYLINQNGIIFGGSSQINTHNLTASALPINDHLIARGLLNNPDKQFLFSALTVPALETNGTQPSFTPPVSHLPGGRTGDVIVQRGARIIAPTTSSNVGGRVALIGANVTNAGTISTPDGQTILAAGLQVGLAAHDSSDASVRGLDVTIGQVADPATSLPDYAGTAINVGLIDAPRANTTLAGKNVQQNGFIHSTTSVSLNGSIRLLADYDARIRVITSNVSLSPTLTGNVSLGKNSIAEILPELDSSETVVGQTLALRSQVEIQGRNIHLGTRSQLLAPSGKITLETGSWLDNNGFTFVHDQGQIYVDEGAVIDVAGTAAVDVPISQYILEAQVRGAETANSPLQRKGPFRGQTIFIDSRKTGTFNGLAWVGTPLADVSGYAGLIKHSVGELTTTGGSVSLTAGSSVVLQNGSKIDVAAGWKNVLGGQVQTTRVLAGGRLIDIADATPDQIYDGFYNGTFTQNFAKYGISNTFSNALKLDGSHYEPGYIEGAKAGSIAITAPSQALDGTLTGQSVAGERQRADTSLLSSLSLAFRAQESTGGFLPIYSRPPTIIFQPDTTQTRVGAFSLDHTDLGLSRERTVLLSPELLKSFGNFTIENNDGDVLLPVGQTLSAPAGGSLTIRAANIDIAGRIESAGSALIFEAHNITQADLNQITSSPSPTLPTASLTRGIFTLASTGSLTTAGLLVDDRLGISELPSVIAGGSISIQTYTADLEEGSKIDVSGGVQADAKGRVTYGKGGSLSIKAGQDTRLAAVSGGHFVNLATLRGYSGSIGGTLTLLAQLIDIGGTPRNGALGLQPEFFSQGGFSQFNLIGLGAAAEDHSILPGLVIAENTRIAPVVESFRLALSPELALRKMTLAEGQRSPVSLAFSAPGIRNDFGSGLVVRGDLKMQSGASIRTDALGHVSFSGSTVELHGNVTAPGGTITVSGSTNSTSIFQEQNLALATVYLGPESVLSTAGTTLLAPDPIYPEGRRIGQVLAGGEISITGNIVAASGALLDVSGATDVLDFSPAAAQALETFAISPSSGVNAPLARLQTVSQNVASNGGRITFTGGQMLFTDATLAGRAGGSTALGGSLSVASSRFQISGDVSPLSPNLIVQQSGPTLPAEFESNQSAIGHSIAQTGNVSLGHFAADDFQRGGFGSLALNGSVQFSGPVELQANGTLSVASNGVIYADSKVALTAAYVILGRPFAAPGLVGEQQSPFAPLNVLPQFGPGQLAVTANWIDVGFLTLQGIGKTSLTAGDIRGNGTLQVAGQLALDAGQIYPVSATDFSIIAYDGTSPGCIRISNHGSNRPLPYSAGGHLGIYASNIQQNGTLRAPFGSITLGWDGTGTALVDLLSGSHVPTTIALKLGSGSTTSVSAIDPATGQAAILPYGILRNGTTWIDPTGADISLSGPPQKAIHLSSQNITLARGAEVDLRGGGDLLAYEWIKGQGGTTDVLESASSFAVIPDYEANIAPYAPFNGSSNPHNLLADAGLGYTSPGLHAGDRIYLSGSASLPAGYYTLLPARYALLKNAVLVTPKTTSPTGTIEMADGASLVSGYRYSGLTGEAKGAGGITQFEVAPAAVIQSRSEFNTYLANAFFTNNARQREIIAPRLPGDGGQLVLQASSSLILQAVIQSQAALGGRGGIVDISSPLDILISGHRSTVDTTGKLVLDSTSLSHFGAESLLIGGTRSFTSSGTKISTNTGSITVDNAGSPLSAPDLILVASDDLTLSDHSQVSASGRTLGDVSNLLVDGNGLLVRVTTQPEVSISRSGVTTASQLLLTIGAGSRISGTSITLDSSSATNLASTARLLGQSIYLNSGQISLQLGSESVGSTDGLILSGDALQSLQRSQNLSLVSYSSIDIYGSGTIGSSALASLSLHAGELRGFDTGSVTFEAGDIYLDNSAGGSVAGTNNVLQGSLSFHAGTIHLGDGNWLVDQFASLTLEGKQGILFDGSGSLGSAGDITLRAPVITGAAAQTYSILSEKLLTIEGSAGPSIVGGLGAKLTLQGTSITQTGDILLPSGQLVVHATSGDLNVNGLLDASGVAQRFFDVVRTSNGGSIQLISDAGDVMLGSQAVVNVSANRLLGNAGTLSISAAHGDLSIAGKILGQNAGAGTAGSFALDIGSLAETTYNALQARLQTGGFLESQTYRIRTGDFTLSGITTAHRFALSTDDGGIDVSGQIDASGATGGVISLQAAGNLTIANGALLNVAGEEFDHAGKGGSIYLATESQLDLHSGSNLLLGVGDVSDATLGHFNGTLHLRAPQNATSTDLALAPILANISNASSILIEGYKVFDLTSSGGAITSTVQTNIRNNGTTFLGAAGTTTASYMAMRDRVLGGQPSDASNIAIFAPGAEVINRTGNLTLGTTNSTATSDWNLSTWRFGPKSAPGVLTLRAASDIVFYNALSDGFLSSTRPLYQHLLLAQNPLLPINTQSWSYHLTAGADLTAAAYESTLTSGNLLLGKNNGTNSSNSNSGPDATTSVALNNRFQVIRTGSGDIDIHAAGSIRLLNQFASIYTVGTQVLDPTLSGLFDVPSLRQTISEQGDLGSPQQSPTYRAQYSLAGGNVSLFAGENIEHLTLLNGELVPDSQRELPNNWLYRRGYFDALTGDFAQGSVGGIATTTWWIDFSNFFEGVGTLGGGNIVLQAGNDVSNVDASAPTNLRMTKGPVSTSTAYELGGGDLTVTAGNNIDAGVYYVEKGHGILQAGGSILTNKTRSPALGNLASDYTEAPTWLPTTLFLGKGGFDVSARNDVLLGPVANPFLLPGGFNNTFWFKTYFSTYASDSYVHATSLGGDVTFREKITMPADGSNSQSVPVLLAWLGRVSLLTTAPTSASYYQPWLRLNETSVASFSTAATLLPGTITATAFTGNIDLVGDLTLSPSATGTIELLAGGAINGLQPNGVITTDNGDAITHGVARINLSDANPDAIPGICSPLAYQSVVGTSASPNATSGIDFLQSLDALFDETGATSGRRSVLQSRQTLHTPGLLHLGDTSPVRLYASAGDLSGVTLFSPKATRVYAGRDILDIAFYLQNLAATDTSIVSSGRDLIPYSSSSPLRALASSTGHILNTDATPLAGDLQIAGPGTLEVLAGRDLDLGISPGAGDGTSAGITSIGNARNPYLAFDGASIIAGAGVGAIDYDGFIERFLLPNDATSASYFTELGTTAAAFGKLSDEEKHHLALQAFYLVLRDSGRSQSSSPDNYVTGFAAIAALFPGHHAGDISLTSRQIKTKNGGDISLFAPGGSLTVGFDVAGTQPLDQGILTEAGGNISIFTQGSVTVGTSRIFTLRGGNEIIWSSEGDIAAGASSKTVQSAPPTRVLLDPQSGDVQTDLAGLATGGGIGVLATVKDVPPGDVDLIAPSGTVDAGDAGIRVSGNLNIAAVQVLNADNIQASGTIVGTPNIVVSVPNLAGLTAASNTAAASTNAATEAARQNQNPGQQEELPSLITVEVLGYGG